MIVMLVIALLLATLNVGFHAGEGDYGFGLWLNVGAAVTATVLLVAEVRSDRPR